jgi:hypothetical protein
MDEQSSLNIILYLDGDPEATVSKSSILFHPDPANLAISLAALTRPGSFCDI